MRAGLKAPLAAAALLAASAAQAILTQAVMTRAAMAQARTAQGPTAQGPGAQTAAPSYLDPALVPDAGAIIPPPPRVGSPAQDLDSQTYLDSRAAEQRRDGGWALARQDTRQDAGQMLQSFGCALGLSLTPDKAPRLAQLLARSAVLVRSQVAPAQLRFARERPFAGNHLAICVSRFSGLGRTPSYPSGQAALGWAFALILAEIAPERAVPILARGQGIGESGVTCGVQWRSDVDAARLDAAALVAVLHASAAFRADLDQARRETADARRRARSPVGCP